MGPSGHPRRLAEAGGGWRRLAAAGGGWRSGRREGEGEKQLRVVTLRAGPAHVAGLPVPCVGGLLRRDRP